MSIISHYAGIATTIVDFTNELSPLLSGLVALTALSAVGIAWEALRAYWAHTITWRPHHTPRFTSHPKAA